MSDLFNQLMKTNKHSNPGFSNDLDSIGREFHGEDGKQEERRKGGEVMRKSKGWIGVGSFGSKVNLAPVQKVCKCF